MILIYSQGCNSLHSSFKSVKSFEPFFVLNDIFSGPSFFGTFWSIWIDLFILVDH